MSFGFAITLISYVETLVLKNHVNSYYPSVESLTGLPLSLVAMIVATAVTAFAGFVVVLLGFSMLIGGGTE